MKKRLLTLLLALCMICSLLPFGVLADGESEHEHSYTEKVVPPTCTEAGYTLHVCACGDSYKDNEVPATGHKTELRNAKEATCAVKGYTGDEVCTVCGKTIEKGKATDRLEHKWDEGYDTKKPTCGSKGAKIYTCEVCGANKTEDVPATGQHTVELKNVKEATCTAGGYSGDKVCKTCGETVEKGKNLPALGHDYKNGKCTRCGEKSAVKQDNPFVDVKEGKYYYEPVFWALGKKITKGVDYTHFAPDAGCTRAQIVTFLWRANDCPSPKKYNEDFEDISKDAYYYKAVNWAIENKITFGTDETHFAPDDVCTRAQAVTFLWRAKESPDPANMKNPFKDVSKEAFYYMAMLWAVDNEVTIGVDGTHFAPNDTCTRGQIVTFLYRAMA